MEKSDPSIDCHLPFLLIDWDSIQVKSSPEGNSSRKQKRKPQCYFNVGFGISEEERMVQIIQSVLLIEKKNMFERLKRFFSSEIKPKQEKKERKKSWHKSRCPSPIRPPSLREAEQKENGHAVVVTSAEADMWLVGISSSRTRAKGFAAIKIQSAFRGLLLILAVTTFEARRALRALKGLVKLQALIRGQAVRHQTTMTLKGLQALMRIQSEACAMRVRSAEDHRAGEGNNMVYAKAKGLTLQQNINKGWDSSTLSKEEMVALMNNRQEAAMRRERAMEYAFSHQERRRPMTPVSKEYEPNVKDKRWSWLDQWAGAQHLDNDIPDIFSTSRRDQKIKEKVEETQLRRTSLKDDDLFSSSPSFLSYEAPTASAKSKFRVLSPFPSNASDIGRNKNHHLLKSPSVALISDRSLKYSGGL